MLIGAFTSCMHDRTIDEALDVLVDLGLNSAEVNVGGFVFHPHCPVDTLLVSSSARDDYLEKFASRGIRLTALNANGNPLHPDPEVGFQQSGDLRRAVTLAGLLGVDRVVTMSGLPGLPIPGSRWPHWAVLPWDDCQSEVATWQWTEVAIPFWKEMEQRAIDAGGVRIALEAHPHMLVYNAATLLRLVDAVGSSHLGAEMDPSHLFWQGMDPIAVIERLGALVFNAAAKDTRMNPAVAINGVLDDRFTPVQDRENAISSGGRYLFNDWPEDSSWQFVTVGKGHDVTWWSGFLDALRKVDPEMPVNIEHEDFELTLPEGLELAAGNLHAAESMLT